MRITTPNTLLAIAFGLATATTATVAFCGPPRADGPPGANAGCPDRRLALITERLNLTPEQETQVKTIMAEARTAALRMQGDTRKRIDAVLTAAQRAEQQAQRQQRMGQRAERLAQRLNLTAEQTTQVRAILEEPGGQPGFDRWAARERIAAVLTPEQRQQLDGPRGHSRGKMDCAPGPDELLGEPDDDLDDGPDQG